MNHFKYKAYDSNNQYTEGVIQAFNRQDAIADLIKKGMSIRELEKTSFRSKNGNTIELTSSEQEDFCSLFGSLYGAGIPVISLIEELAKVTKEQNMHRLHRVTKLLEDDIKSGASLSQAMSKYDLAFGKYFVAVVQNGEASGTLIESFRTLQDSMKFARENRSAIKGALRMPAITLLVGIIGFFIVTIYALPKFKGLFAMIKSDQMPAISLALMNFSDFMMAYGGYMLPFAALGIYGFRKWVRSPKGRYQWHRFLISIPAFGALMRKAAIARFFDSFSTTMRSGLTSVEAIKMAIPCLDNDYLMHKAESIIDRIKEGRNLSDAFHSADLFDPVSMVYLKAADNSGNLDELLGKLADRQKQEVRDAIEAFPDAIKPLVLSVIGGLFAILALGTMLPSVALMQSLLSS